MHKLCIFTILATYPHYDGIVWPELQSAGTSGGYFSKAWNWAFGSKSKGSTTASASAAAFEQNFVNIKNLQHNDHIQYRIKALRMYLEVLKVKLHVQETRNNPVQFVRMIYAIYDSLNSRFLFYDESEIEWKFNEVAQVRNIYLN